MKKLTLDYSRWRCGKDGSYQIGTGYTKLLNNHGYMCCLGQFSLQLNEELKESELLNFGYPHQVSDLTKKMIKFLVLDGHFLNASELSIEAVKINDNEKIDNEERIKQLKELFLQHDFEIEVINKPL